MENEVKPKEKKEISLPLRQRKFLKYYLESGNASISAKKAGYKDIRHSYTILQNPTFRAIFMHLLDKSGLSDKKIVDKLLELLEAKKIISANITYGDADEKTDDFIEVPDNQTRMKALELLVKIKHHSDAGEVNAAQNDLKIIIINPQSRGSEHNGSTIHIDAETGPCV